MEFALIETSGDINVLLKKEHQPLTAADLGIKVGVEQESRAVIMDGKIMDQPLAACQLDRNWLLAEAEKAESDQRSGVSRTSGYLRTAVCRFVRTIR